MATTPRQNAHDRVVGELERLVFTDLHPGAALPSESELVERLGVSRLTVREAVRSLQARGLIDVHHGRRPVVARLNAGAIEDFFTSSIRHDPRSVLDLLDVRRALEVHMAALAAGRVDRTASAAMADAISAMEQSLDDPEAFDAADVRFHEAVASAGGNQILTFLIEAMAEPLRASRSLSRHGYLAHGHSLAGVVDEHTRIYRCIVNGDAAGAADAMRAHLDQTERSLHRGLDVAAPDGLVDPFTATPTTTREASANGPRDSADHRGEMSG